MRHGTETFPPRTSLASSNKGWWPASAKYFAVDKPAKPVIHLEVRVNSSIRKRVAIIIYFVILCIHHGENILHSLGPSSLNGKWRIWLPVVPFKLVRIESESNKKIRIQLNITRSLLWMSKNKGKQKELKFILINTRNTPKTSPLTVSQAKINTKC